MQQTAHHPKDITLSNEDTLGKKNLAEMGVFFDKHSYRIFDNVDAYAAIFAYTDITDFWNYAKNEIIEGKEHTLRQHTYLCHNPFNDATKKCSGIINIYSKCIRPSARPFLEFILDEKGIFGKATSKLTVIRDKTRDNYPIGTVVTKMDDMPIQLYSSFQITGRLLTGWGLDLVWYRLVNAGLSPEAALCLTSLYTWNADGVVLSGTNRDGRFDDDPSNHLVCNGPFKSDQPFSSFFPSFSPRRVMDHDPDSDMTSITEGTRPNPCNIIWHEEHLSAKRNKCAFYKKNSTNSDIAKVIKTSGKFTKNQVSKIEKDMYDAREQVIV